MADPAQVQSGFLRLSTELRLAIYQYAIPEATFSMIWTRNIILLHLESQIYGKSYGAPIDYPCYDPSSKPSSLLLISRQVRSEALPVFHDRLHFFMDCNTEYWDDTMYLLWE